MFTFRERVRDMASLSSRIKNILSSRLAMHIGELCLRLGEAEEIVRVQLDVMAATGMVERLRPIGYERSDMDFFRLPGNGATLINKKNGSHEQDSAENVLVLEDVVSEMV